MERERGPERGPERGERGGERRDERRDDRRGGREERGGRRDDRRGGGREERGGRGGGGERGRPWGERREERGPPRESAPRPPMREPREVVEQPRETMEFDEGRAGAEDEGVEVVQAGGVEGREGFYLGLLNELGGKLQAVFLDERGGKMGDPIPVRDLADTLRKEGGNIKTVVFDGVITQRLLDIASEKSIATLVGVKTGNITKRPGNVEVVTRSDLERG
jgi:hypothetical protein